MAPRAKPPEIVVDGYLDHVSMLYRTGQYDRANQIVDEGTKRFGDDDKPFLSMLIAVADKQGKRDVRDRHLARCRSLNDEGLKKDCDLAAGGKGDDQGVKAPRINVKSLPGLPSSPF